MRLPPANVAYGRRNKPRDSMAAFISSVLHAASDTVLRSPFTRPISLSRLLWDAFVLFRLASVAIQRVR